jgi:hypothetical protein
MIVQDRGVVCSIPPGGERIPLSLCGTLLFVVRSILETAQGLAGTSQTFTVWSQLPLARRVPSGLKHTLLTSSVWS